MRLFLIPCFGVLICALSSLSFLHSPRYWFPALTNLLWRILQRQLPLTTRRARRRILLCLLINLPKCSPMLRPRMRTTWVPYSLVHDPRLIVHLSSQIPESNTIIPPEPESSVREAPGIEFVSSVSTHIRMNISNLTHF